MEYDEDGTTGPAFLKVPQVGSVRAGRVQWEPLQLALKFARRSIIGVGGGT